MRKAFTFTAGLSTSLALVVLAGVKFAQRRTRLTQVFPQAGVEAWSKASALVAVAAFVAAVAFSLAAIATFGFRKKWPTSTFVFGILGAVAGGIVDAWCVYVTHSA